MLFITGSTGQLGRLVIAKLLETVPAGGIVAGARDPAKAKDLTARGVQVRQADYNRPETLAAAFAGVDTVLLISSSELGGRFPQHKAVIDAAKSAGVRLLAYTSVLHAQSSSLGLAAEHVETERYLEQSGVPFVLLRNGWYTENYTAGIPAALQHGVLLGCAGEGRISSAARADYAAAAARVLTLPDQAGKVYELAGDTSYTLTELAAEISRQSGKDIPYKNMEEPEYKAVLLQAGLPEPLAALLSDSDTGASKGDLFDASGTLGRLLGRPTTPPADSVQAVLQGRP